MTQADRTLSNSFAESKLSFPPYGLINTENARYLATRPVPEGFRRDPTSPRPSDAEEWEEWLIELAQEMSDFLWPIYQDNEWVGRAVAHAMDLTQIDLMVMQALQPTMEERIRGAISPTDRHRIAWAHEDEGPPRFTLALYQAVWPAELEADLNRAILTGGVDIARPASQGLKKLFQRPRPQLTALTLGLKDGLEVQPSKSAITPSMISGHCIQGTMALAQVHYWLADAAKQRPGLLQLLNRFLIDTGDRRVFAGLHYPSDNIGSWFVSLRLCAHVYGDGAARVRSGLWSAIQECSTVFKAMKEQGGLYTDLLAKLEATVSSSSSADQGAAAS
ncbi:phosphatase PAP2 family protein [Variovorax sp. WS11]|uniref:phosphatase PAP2 family protein n=1 Tax=Variovorax sp. WS11 TaxID=1105204 RepID=UPI0013DCE833|nr:phosphatase PAP2 family protein [Variovorax sp. WS11]NDZ16734.1 phosphatase PAP2 family protein [Variovorax sp. WS11]